MVCGNSFQRIGLKTRRSTNFHLRNIARIRKYIISRLDYCNSLLSGITKSNLKRLTITELPNLFSLLTVGERMEKRIQFKTLLYVFKCLLNGIAPVYLFNMFLLRPGLRSSSDKTQLKMFFLLFSPDSDRLSLNFHRFVILYISCDTRSVGLGQYCLPKVHVGVFDVRSRQSLPRLTSQKG